MPLTGVDAAIQELEREVKRVQEAIALLKKIRLQRVLPAAGNGKKARRLSAAGRRRISEAAKKRWAALRAATKPQR
ncbi:MAG TPA: hypothetical protein VNN17_08045 [Terriglobia bacterium]|nr:hypothetical protein [Terriglobia bacterium]